MLAGVVHLEFYVGGEVREGSVYDIRDHDEINSFVGIVRADAERQEIIRHGQFFVGHPAGDFDELLHVRADVARIFDHGRQAIEDGTADGFGPTHLLTLRRPPRSWNLLQIVETVVVPGGPSSY